MDDTSLLGEEWVGGCTAENGTSTVTPTPVYLLLSGGVIPGNPILMENSARGRE